jgi:hypothetical protein
MKLLVTLIAGITLSASLPALAETTTSNSSVTAESHGPDGDWHRGHRGQGWDHGGWHHRHHRRHCGPFGRWWCEVNPDTQDAQISE